MSDLPGAKSLNGKLYAKKQCRILACMERIDNFRDIGGYKAQDGLAVKKGMIYRSGSLAYASAADLQQLAALGIKTVCDLRSHYERDRAPDPDLGVKSVHIPIQVSRQDSSGVLRQLYNQLFGPARRWDYAQEISETYREYVTNFCDAFSEVIHLAAEPSNLPILIHCTAGKDRTGYAISLIQLLLDVPLELVFQDYMLTNEYLGRFRAEMLRRLKFFTPFGLSTRRFLPLFDARREYLAAAFDQIQHTHGAIENYFLNCLGISHADRAQLVMHLLSAPLAPSALH